MENIIIKSFGPIKDAEINIKDINIYIGTTSSGKSTVAKLISIFKGRHLGNGNATIEGFKRMLANYNIDFAITEDTYIKYIHGNLYYEIKSKSLNTNYQKNGDDGVLNPIYIPAERVFFSTLSQSIFSLINSDIALPKWLTDFGAKFEKARISVKRLPLDFLNVRYEFRDGVDYIVLPNDTSIKLSQASSGIQSNLPLLLVIQHNTSEGKPGGDDIFVIEEPELNLYPASQKDLIEFIIGKINLSKDKLIITTHSPYLLTSIDNLIQASNAAKAKPELRDEIAKLIPPSLWIDYENVTCYYFNDETAISTLDTEIQSIGPSNIDDVSSNISETFEHLLSLKYAD